MNATAKDFYLEKEMDFLNNGSFGACPKSVIAVQRQWQELMESQLIRFFMKELPAAIRTSAQALAPMIGANPKDIAFVDNATSGCNAVIRSLMPTWSSKDTVLTTNHCYGAVLNTLRYAQDCTNINIVCAEVPFPLYDKSQVTEAVIHQLNDGVKLVVLDHITSATGIIFPVEDIIQECRKRGIPILIDGAHAPGMLDLSLQDLAPDWYTGNCHKWLFAPKGCAFLWTNPARQAETHPTVISHGYEMGYAQEFDFVGTKDYSPFLTLPAAIEYYNQWGFHTIYDHNHSLMLQMRDYLCQEWEIEPPAPSSMLGYMATLPCPIEGEATLENVFRIHDNLWNEHRIEIPIIPFNGKLWWRISAQIFNSPEDYEKLCRIGKQHFMKIRKR